MIGKVHIRQFIQRILDRNQMKEYARIYKGFDKTDYDGFTVENLPSESMIYWGEMIKWAKDIRPKCALFAGENKATAKILKEKIDAGEVLTTGLSDVDYKWDFEDDPPIIDKQVDIVVSQAILEHLLNPYKHVQDLTNLVCSRGHILIHTVMPGYCYHRYPIDAIRFFPDWFEEVRKRLNLRIVNKRLRDTHIFYMYKKP